MRPVPNHVRFAPNQYPVRLDLRDGQSMWRGVRDFEHSTLCRAFGLDPIRFFFDLPSSVRGIGSNMTGFGGNRGTRTINGYVMQAGDTTPWGTITVCSPGEKFRDVDPTDPREQLRLS